MFTVIFLEMSITFVLKLYSLNVIKKIENRIESLRIEIESGHLNRYPAIAFTVTFDQFNVSLLNKSNNFFKKILLATFEVCVC